MTRLISSKEEGPQPNLQFEAAISCNEAEQILHLKQLLVTLKQHYEKNLYTSQAELQSEQKQRFALEKELHKLQTEHMISQQFHEEELKALHDQQTTLKERLKKAQDELKHLQDSLASTSSKSNKDSPDLSDQLEKTKEENKRLYEELNEAQQKLKVLEQELCENKHYSQRESERLQQLLKVQQQQEEQIETVVSQNSSHQLRRELEVIKRDLAQGSQETKALEARYIETLNEKIKLEHECKQLQLQLEHQSSNLTSFQSQLHLIENVKKNLELTLQSKEIQYQEMNQQSQDLQQRIHDLEEKILEKEPIQDKYEQLKDEWKQLQEGLEEATEARLQAQQRLVQLENMTMHQDIQLQELTQQLQALYEEKQTLESEREQLKILLEESEVRLRVAQQHLAKKVKEAALLNEKVEEQQAHLTDFLQNVEHQKNQLAQLQASVDLYQRQEKRLQEQLHDALKGSESQVTKWEEKYFSMYDKWQESENKIRELKKFEEKHHQMQSLIANLGSFMHSSIHASSSSSYPDYPTSSVFINSPLTETPSSPPKMESSSKEERYDLFGMRHSSEL